MDGDMIGRHEERELLGWLLTRDGREARGLVVTGEPGVGKSSVFGHALAVASGQGMTVLQARPVLSESTLAFAGLGDLVNGLEEQRRRLQAPRRRALEVAMLEAFPEGGEPIDLRSVALSLHALLVQLSMEQHVLVAIDDAQWLDESTSMVLTFAARRLHDVPVRWLLTRRQGEANGMDLGGLAPVVVREHALSAMNLAELHHLVEGRLGARLSRPMLVKVERISAGNPFYALELARHFLSGTGREDSSSQTVPLSLRTLIGARLDRLPSPVRQLLSIAALAASPSIDLLSRVGQVEKATVGDRLGLAERAHVVNVGQRVVFAHPLIAAVVVDETDPAERLRVHHALALEASSEEERARHAALAIEVPDRDVADQLEAAALSARQRGAGFSAAELSRLALERTTADAGTDRERRLLLAADIAFQLGDTVSARGLALSLEKAHEVAVRSAALLLLARIAWLSGPVGDVARYGELAVMATSGDPIALAQVKVTLAHLSRHDRAWGQRHARGAVEILDRAGVTSNPTRARALTALLDVETDLGLPPQADMFEEALALAPTVEPGRVQDSTRYYLATILLQRDELDRSRTVFLDCVHAAEQRADDSSLAALWDQLGILELLAGDWPAARSYAARQVLSGEANEQPMQCLWGHLTALCLDVRQGVGDSANLVAALLHEVRATGDPMSLAFTLVIEAEARRLRGDPAVAATCLRELDEIALAIQVMSPNAFRHGADLVEVLVESGDVAAAESAAARLSHAAARGELPWAVAVSARANATLAAARGDLDEALHQAQTSVGLTRSLGMPFEVGKSLLTLGGVLRRRRAKSVAAAVLEEACVVFDDLDARPWADLATAQHRALGLRPRVGNGLTPTECRVAELAAEGLTNPEIAGRLAMSRKTVEFNLSKVYRKLQIRNRAQLATALATMSGIKSGEMPGSFQ